MALQRQEQQLEHGPEDWFGNATKRATPDRPSKDSRTISFGKSIGAGRQYSQSKGGSPSLLARLGDRVDGSWLSRVEGDSHRPPNGPRNDHDNRRRYQERPSKESYSERYYSHQGSRYKGGYGRG